MNIKQNLVSSSKYSIKCPYTMAPEFIVVHNTANDASAENEIKYMNSNNEKVSYHYAIDDKEIVQGIPENRNAWHAGDGGSGKGNRKGIAIEICYSKSGGDRFIQAEKNAAQFIAEKLKEKGWGIDKVKKHQDFANKYCPHRTLDMGWDRFLNMIKSYMTKPDLQYQVHLEELGWMGIQDAGDGAGTEGQNRRLEAVKFFANNGLEIKYRAHVQDIGWQEWKNSGEVAGTTGQCKRIEAIEIQCNKELEVEEHIENIGWMPKFKSRNFVIGTVGRSLRLEAFRIKVL